MATVTVRTPGKVNRRIAGVAFSEGRAEVDTDSAAFQFFKRRGYDIVSEGEQPDESDEQHEDKQEPADDQEQEPDDESERPHPVQGSKAVWFEYLTKIKPDHGFDLEKVSRKELIVAAEAVEAPEA